MTTTKSFTIPKQAVWKAYKEVRANRGAAGVDGESIDDFDGKLAENLYKLWNRMSSGSYMPPPVRVVEIPKASGGKRPLGIPTVADRIAQAVVKAQLEPKAEPKFHEHSYGYRPRKSAHQAVENAKQQCWRRAWCIDLDIKGFFDNIDHTLMMKAVRVHTNEKWILLYVERWLKAPAQQEDGTIVTRTKGTPQGGVVSPLLANIFLHHAFDAWMRRTYPEVPFERYADDVLIHCETEAQARAVLDSVATRLGECKLELNPTKTHIVYCKQANRKGSYPKESLDFLGFTFRPRQVRTRGNKMSVSFSPAVSNTAGKHIRQTIKKWRLNRRTGTTIQQLADQYNDVVRGWVQYYGKFRRSALVYSLRQIERYLVRWVRAKYKLSWGRAIHWLKQVARSVPNLFEHWKVGVRYTT